MEVGEINFAQLVTSSGDFNKATSIQEWLKELAFIHHKGVKIL
jgi:hypothetical protein